MSTAQINSRVSLAIAVSVLTHALFVVSLVLRAHSQQTNPSTISVSLVRMAEKKSPFGKGGKGGLPRSNHEKIPLPPFPKGEQSQDQEPVIASAGAHAIQVLHADSAETSGSETSRSPSPDHIVEPIYTPRALRARIEGRVALDVVIGKNGRVIDASITKGLGYGLDENALEAIRQSTFTPARNATGDLIDERIIYRFRFKLPPGVASSIANR